MKNLFLITLLFLAACGQKKSPVTDESNHNADARDSLTVDTSVEFVTGQFNFRDHDDFVKIDPQYANKEIYLHKKAYSAFKTMADSAESDGIDFVIISGARNFNYQKSIWDRKWRASEAPTDSAKAREILEYSSMPMTSRHHWGTEVDINDLNNSYFESGKGQKEYEWLKAHANNFGFYQPYTKKSENGRTGYNEEKWHWSYMPLAGPYLEYYNRNVTNENITGFEGADLADDIDMVKNFVNGVSVEVKDYNK